MSRRTQMGVQPSAGETRRAGDKASLCAWQRIQEAFGWMKNVVRIRRPMLRGLYRMGFTFKVTYDLVGPFPSWRGTVEGRLLQPRRTQRLGCRAGGRSKIALGAMKTSLNTA